jgi:hypothetical protein
MLRCVSTDEVVPPDWLNMLRSERAMPRKPIVTIRDFAATAA